MAEEKLVALSIKISKGKSNLQYEESFEKTLKQSLRHKAPLEIKDYS